MSKRGTWGPMSGRVQPYEADQAPPTPPPAGLKHCWVVDEHGRLPALLLEWRRVESGFQGRVVRPVSKQGAWVVVEEWLPAHMLERA